jgi:hypothetical protein
MPTLRYVGPIDEVDVVGVGTFKRGDELEVSDDLASGLLAQADNFESVKTTKKKEA